MSEDVVKRCILEGEYIVKTGATVRKTAKEFMFSKSTVHKDVTERLSKLNYTLYKKVKRILDKNFSERHIRGGEATKQKYLKFKSL